MKATNDSDLIDEDPSQGDLNMGTDIQGVWRRTLIYRLRGRTIDQRAGESMCDALDRVTATDSTPISLTDDQLRQVETELVQRMNVGLEAEDDDSDLIDEDPNVLDVLDDDISPELAAKIAAALKKLEQPKPRRIVPVGDIFRAEAKERRASGLRLEGEGLPEQKRKEYALASLCERLAARFDAGISLVEVLNLGERLSEEQAGCLIGALKKQDREEAQ